MRGKERRLKVCGDGASSMDCVGNNGTPEVAGAFVSGYADFGPLRVLRLQLALTTRPGLAVVYTSHSWYVSFHLRVSSAV